MKLIDLLIKKANGEIKDGTKVVFQNYIYQYNKNKNIFEGTNGNHSLGRTWNLEIHLDDEIIIF